MGKITKYSILGFVIIGVLLIALGQLGLFSGSAPENLGAERGRLVPPTTAKNSVSSQADYFNNTSANTQYAKIEPLNYRGLGKAALIQLKELINSSYTEASLIKESENYLRYEFRTSLMKFTDDVEFLLNENENYIHFRSASRIGQKDFGRNRERMEEIRKKFLKLNEEAVK